MKKKKMKPVKWETLYLVVIDNSGEDSPTEIKKMTKKEISKLEYRDYVAVINGSIVKDFASKFDIGRL